MNTDKPTRRDLALTLAAAGGAALVSLPAASANADDEPGVAAALAASPAPLSAAQRVDVRNGARSLAKALVEARKKTVPNDVDPACVYLPGGGQR